MNIRYAFVSAIAILLGAVLMFLPEKQLKIEKNPVDLLLAINDESRWISTDELAHSIVEKDPYFLLIDVRSEDEYQTFSLPGSLHIPLDSIQSPNYLPYLQQEGLRKIFYSNTSAKATQAWVLSKRRNLSNIYVLEGGVNRWVETILNPVKPASTAPQEEFDLYSFRVAASQYFGNSAEETVESEAPKKPMIQVSRKKKAAQGGC